MYVRMYEKYVCMYEKYIKLLLDIDAIHPLLYFSLTVLPFFLLSQSVKWMVQISTFLQADDLRTVLTSVSAYTFCASRKQWFSSTRALGLTLTQSTTLSRTRLKWKQSFPTVTKSSLGLTEWYAVHQQENIYGMRSRTVSRKHLLQSNYCKLLGWISSSNAKFLAHGRAEKEEWDTAECSTVLIFSLSSRKWQKYVLFYFFAVLSGQRRWYRKTETVKLEICLLVSWIMKV